MPRRSLKSSCQPICRTVSAMLLVVCFLGLLSAFTAFGIFTGDRELLARVLKIVAYGIVFSCAWAGGTSWLQRRPKEGTNRLKKAVKDLDPDPVSLNVRSPKRRVN